MQQNSQWPESHSEQTDILPRVDAQQAQPDSNATESTQYIAAHDAPTQQLSSTGQGGGTPPPGQPGGTAAKPSRPRWRRPGIIAAAVFGFLVLVYGLDLLFTSGDIPRGVTVAGVDVGGMSHSEAENLLREEIEPRLNQPVAYSAGEVTGELNPKESGLALDWDATLEQAGDQPLNPFTRISSFFTTTELGVVTQAEPNQFDNAMKALRKDIDQEPVEGDVVFEGARPKAVEPKQGQKLQTEAAQETILTHWASGERLTLPVTSTPVTVPMEEVQKALREVAQPAMSGPVTVHGEGADGVLEPEEIAEGLSFEAKNGSLVPKIDQKKIVAGVEPELASTEKEGKDAKIVFQGGKPAVEPSEDGNQIKWDETLKPLLDVLKKTEGRELTATYEKKPAELTTEEAEGLGIKEVIGEFSTGGFAADSGVNIRVVAEEVNGAIVKPGETFSLNEYTGPRTKAEGYVEAGIIQDGAPGKAVGGGISQFATTLYNAYYNAGLKDAGHQEHSYYISRYPKGREATVFQNPDGSSVIDLKFTNDSPHGVAIQTIWTPSDITVRLWGTKRYEVVGQTGPETNHVPPHTVEGPKENCHASAGAPGFTVTDTRILKDIETGQEVRREERTVKYNPQPKIVCKNKD
ncbi:VanW family protein [Saccharomonospora cyanea]|uniref:Putative vancomycin resistance protein n=1 Tax=Saccharomonospora cyanea NA-134 TaxID=882082 RepID=H5XFB3_9PSEU|nr:VanW family protein [Saccharomonospora cyanea]EHR62536.1 putative vancomycin resistance protein [Saccharomonospora cyanea NA-134]